jgi:hypothetical protein
MVGLDRGHNFDLGGARMSARDLNEDVVLELQSMSRGLKYVIIPKMLESARTEDLTRYPNFSPRGLALYIYCRRGRPLEDQEITWELKHESDHN